MRPLASHLLPLGLLASLTAVGCGGEELGPDPDVSLLLPAPTLRSLAPTELTVGEEVTILAEDLPEKYQAEVKIHLDGNYVTATGKEYHFEGNLPVTVENPSVATFNFYELYFDPNQAETGTWKGTASLIVVPKLDIDDVSSDAPEIVSNEIDTTLRVGPSIVLDRLQSVEGQNCADVTRATNANHQLALGFRAIGLGVASDANPWTFKLQYSSPEVKVKYIREDVLGGPVVSEAILQQTLLDDSVSTDAPTGINSISVRQTEGDSLLIDPKSRITTAKINPPVEIGMNLFDEVAVGRLAAGAIDSEFGRGSANFVLEVATQDGRTVRRAVSFDIFNEVEIAPYSSPAALVQRYEPEQTCGCVPGGANGRDLQYTEGESYSKNRSLNFRWDQNVATNLGFNVGSFQPVIQATGSETWTESFGVDISEAVTSEKHKSLNLTAHIIPTWNGTCYRQLEEMERKVDIMYHNACGASGIVGQAVLKDWNFSFDVASGPECPPETELPPAESFR